MENIQNPLKSKKSEFDLSAVDFDIYQNLLGVRASMTGARAGDFVRLPDGSLRRIASVNDLNLVHFQVDGTFYQPNYHIKSTGEVVYSGSSDTPTPVMSIVPTGEIMDGEFWFFSENIAGHGRDIIITFPCRVFAVQMSAKTDYASHLDAKYFDELNRFVKSELMENAPVDCPFSVGDVVTFINDFGVAFPDMVVIGFSEPNPCGRFIHIHAKGSAYWFPHKPEELIKQ